MFQFKPLKTITTRAYFFSPPKKMVIMEQCSSTAIVLEHMLFWSMSAKAFPPMSAVAALKHKKITFYLYTARLIKYLPHLRFT